MSRSTSSKALTALLVVALVAVPILEVWLLIQVGQWLGVLPTIAILVAEAVLGAWLMRREGTRAYSALTSAFRTGRMPTRELADAALVLVGGVLLMLPGFATDVIGFFCLLPLTRPVARRLLTGLVGDRLVRLDVPHPFLVGGGDVIEGETVDPGPVRRPSSGSHVITGEVDDGRR
ncbi:MAG TPA: FxsA family protein [Propionibacteriaceae bacterium]